MDDTDRTHRQRGPVAYDFAPKRLSRSRSLTTASQPSQQTPRQVQPLPGEDSAVPTRNKRPSRMNTPVSCWCKCGKCHPMPYEVEHICCQELHFPRKELEGQSCITLDDEFDTICLATIRPQQIRYKIKICRILKECYRDIAGKIEIELNF